MRVIMLADVKGIGKKGQTVEVKDGYASNFLIPRKLAVKETTKSVEILDKQNAEAEAKRLAQEKEVALKYQKLKTEKFQLESQITTVKFFDLKRNLELAHQNIFLLQKCSSH